MRSIRIPWTAVLVVVLAAVPAWTLPREAVHPSDDTEVFTGAEETARGATPARPALGYWKVRLTLRVPATERAVRVGVLMPLSAGPQDAVAVLAARRGTSLGRARTLTALLQAAGVPARLVGGLRLGTAAEKRATNSWVEAWTGSRWIPLDPAGGYFATLPTSYLALYRGDLPLIVHTAGVDVEYGFAIRAATRRAVEGGDGTPGGAHARLAPLPSHPAGRGGPGERPHGSAAALGARAGEPDRRDADGGGGGALEHRRAGARRGRRPPAELAPPPDAAVGPRRPRAGAALGAHADPHPAGHRLARGDRPRRRRARDLRHVRAGDRLARLHHDGSPVGPRDLRRYRGARRPPAGGAAAPPPSGGVAARDPDRARVGGDGRPDTPRCRARHRTAAEHQHLPDGHHVERDRELRRLAGRARNGGGAAHDGGDAAARRRLLSRGRPGGTSVARARVSRGAAGHGRVRRPSREVARRAAAGVLPLLPRRAAWPRRRRGGLAGRGAAFVIGALRRVRSEMLGLNRRNHAYLFAYNPR